MQDNKQMISFQNNLNKYIGATNIKTRRSALFGHTVMLGKPTPAHRALKLAFNFDARCGCPPIPILKASSR